MVDPRGFNEVEYLIYSCNDHKDICEIIRKINELRNKAYIKETEIHKNKEKEVIE